MEKLMDARKFRIAEALLAGALALAGALVSACTVSRQVTLSPRSSIEQRLLVRSLERALAQLDTQPFHGKEVFLELYGFTGDRDFAKALISASLRERGIRLVNQVDQADHNLKVFANGLGVDRAESLLGIPSLAVPLVGVPLPEIPFFKSVQHSGVAEVRFFAFDGPSGRFLEKSPVAVGKASYDNYTVLIFINFTLSDLHNGDGKNE
jgi:hypothetical protein